MSDQWTNEITDMDAEALLKVLERLADAAERIAENTEREEPLRPEERPPAPGTIGGIERNRYPWDPALADTAMGRANGFRNRVQNYLRDRPEVDLAYAVTHVRQQMNQEQDIQIAYLALHPPIPDAAFQPTPTAWQVEANPGLPGGIAFRRFWHDRGLTVDNPRTQVRIDGLTVPEAPEAADIVFTHTNPTDVNPRQG
jgi:hypothetical protein